MTLLAAIFFGVGLAGWTYSKTAHHTGNASPANTLIGAGVVGLIAFIFFFTLLKYVLHIG